MAKLKTPPKPVSTLQKQAIKNALASGTEPGPARVFATLLGIRSFFVAADDVATISVADGIDAVKQAAKVGDDDTVRAGDLNPGMPAKYRESVVDVKTYNAAQLKAFYNRMLALFTAMFGKMLSRAEAVKMIDAYTKASGDDPNAASATSFANFLQSFSGNGVISVMHPKDKEVYQSSWYVIGEILRVLRNANGGHMNMANIFVEQPDGRIAIVQSWLRSQVSTIESAVQTIVGLQEKYMSKNYPVLHYDVWQAGAVLDTEAKSLLRLLVLATKALEAQGAKAVCYGRVLVSDFIKYDPIKKKGATKGWTTTAWVAQYSPVADEFHIAAKNSGLDVYAIAHELGHRWHGKMMTAAQRAAFESAVTGTVTDEEGNSGTVITKSPTSYGFTTVGECFAEWFALYSVGTQTGAVFRPKSAASGLTRGHFRYLAGLEDDPAGHESEKDPYWTPKITAMDSELARLFDLSTEDQSILRTIAGVKQLAEWRSLCKPVWVMENGEPRAKTASEAIFGVREISTDEKGATRSDPSISPFGEINVVWPDLFSRYIEQFKRLKTKILNPTTGKPVTDPDSTAFKNYIGPLLCLIGYMEANDLAHSLSPPSVLSDEETAKAEPWMREFDPNTVDFQNLRPTNIVTTTTGAMVLKAMLDRVYAKFHMPETADSDARKATGVTRLMGVLFGTIGGTTQWRKEANGASTFDQDSSLIFRLLIGPQMIRIPGTNESKRALIHVYVRGVTSTIDQGNPYLYNVIRVTVRPGLTEDGRGVQKWTTLDTTLELDTTKFIEATEQDFVMPVPETLPEPTKDRPVVNPNTRFTPIMEDIRTGPAPTAEDENKPRPGEPGYVSPRFEGIMDPELPPGEQAPTPVSAPRPGNRFQGILDEADPVPGTESAPAAQTPNVPDIDDLLGPAPTPAPVAPPAQPTKSTSAAFGQSTFALNFLANEATSKNSGGRAALTASFGGLTVSNGTDSCTIRIPVTVYYFHGFGLPTDMGSGNIERIDGKSESLGNKTMPRHPSAAMPGGGSRESFLGDIAKGDMYVHREGSSVTLYAIASHGSLEKLIRIGHFSRTGGMPELNRDAKLDVTNTGPAPAASAPSVQAPPHMEPAFPPTAPVQGPMAPVSAPPAGPAPIVMTTPGMAPVINQAPPAPTPDSQMPDLPDDLTVDMARNLAVIYRAAAGARGAISHPLHFGRPRPNTVEGWWQVAVTWANYYSPGTLTRATVSGKTTKQLYDTGMSKASGGYFSRDRVLEFVDKEREEDARIARRDGTAPGSAPSGPAPGTKSTKDPDDIADLF